MYTYIISSGKEPVWRPRRHSGDPRNSGSIPGWGRSPRGGCGNPLQYSCLENPRDGVARWAAVYGIVQSRTWLKQLSSSSIGRKLKKLILVIENSNQFFPSKYWRLFAYIRTDFPGAASGKEPTCQSRRHKRRGFHPWAGKNPWRRAWQPTPVFLSRKSHEQKSLVGYSPWHREELDTTEAT